MQATQNLIEQGDAAFTRRGDQIIFASGHCYKLYGRKSDNKVKMLCDQKPPDFSSWDEPHFQRSYHYVGEAKVIKINRTLKLVIN